MTKEIDVEVISKDEQMWREHLEEAETNLRKSIANVVINEAIVKVSKEEVEKAAKEWKKCT